MNLIEKFLIINEEKVKALKLETRRMQNKEGFIKF